jgi:hypothetical protein
MTYPCSSCNRDEGSPVCLNDSRCEGRTIPAIQFETAEEARKDRAHAEAYYRQAEKMLTANERTLHAEVERLQGELKARHQRQHDAEALAGEYLIQRDDAREKLGRLRYALGDGDGKLTASQLTRRAYELFQKAAKWDEWHEAQNRVEEEMPEGWAFVIQCSPGDWDIYLTDPDGERVAYDRDCDTLAQQMSSAVDQARAAASNT